MIYAIGDIHGSLRMLHDMLDLIKRDAKEEQITRPRIVLLGDLIDRGPDSKGVVDLLLAPAFKQEFDATVLLGNHEEALLESLAGDFDLFARWLHWGGAETVESYGVQFGRNSLNKVYEQFCKTFPSAHIDFLKKCPLTFKYENWLFVHAGIRPSIPLEKQERHDLLWGAKNFLTHKKDFGVGATVVHGHWVTESGEAEILPNRIGVDTGAGYANGKLSAVRLQKGGAVKVFSVPLCKQLS